MLLTWKTCNYKNCSLKIELMHSGNPVWFAFIFLGGGGVCVCVGEIQHWASLTDFFQFPPDRACVFALEPSSLSPHWLVSCFLSRMRVSAKSVLLSHWLLLAYVLMVCCKLMSASSQHPRGHAGKPFKLIMRPWDQLIKPFQTSESTF